MAQELSVPLSSARIGSLTLPATLSQTSVWTANVQLLPFVGISVHTAVVWAVIVGQLPQFDAIVLYWIVSQPVTFSFQLKKSQPGRSSDSVILSGGGTGSNMIGNIVLLCLYFYNGNIHV